MIQWWITRIEAILYTHVSIEKPWLLLLPRIYYSFQVLFGALVGSHCSDLDVGLISRLFTPSQCSFVAYIKFAGETNANAIKSSSVIGNRAGPVQYCSFAKLIGVINMVPVLDLNTQQPPPRTNDRPSHQTAKSSFLASSCGDGRPLSLVSLITD